MVTIFYFAYYERLYLSLSGDTFVIQIDRKLYKLYEFIVDFLTFLFLTLISQLEFKI